MIEAAAFFVIGLFIGAFAMICVIAYLGTAAVKRALSGADQPKGAGPVNIDKPQRFAGGLTIREMRADIAGAEIDVDPTLSVKALFAARNQARAARA